MKRLRQAAYWLTPSLFCLVLYWYGLRAVYQMDDFAWLALHSRIHDVPSFFAAMFQPLAQGTIRPWSERLFFLLGWELFGMDAAPLRGVVFLTQFANLILLTAVTKRLTGSAMAGFVAPLLWLCNSNLYEPLSWTAAYNQIQCAFFLLLALWFWIRHTETGERKFYIWQWVVFVLGFGALEINVVYPAIAALHALCFARAYLKRTAPMFAVSILYAVLHRSVAPPLRSDIYRMYFDGSLFTTLAQYVAWTFGADRIAMYRHLPTWPFVVCEVIAGTALAALIVVLLRRRQWLAAFGVGWFLIVLAPMLPLRNHVSDYYLTIPVIGLCMIAAYGVSLAVRRGRATTGAAAVIVLLYAVPSAWMGRAMTKEYFTVSRRARTFLRSVAYADRLHRDKTLVIRNVDNDLFWAAWWDNAFQLFGRKQIYVAAENEPDLVPMSHRESLSRFVLPAAAALDGMRRGQVVAYDLLPDGRLRNVTILYRSMLERDPVLALPKYIDLGQPLSAAYLGDGWWEPETTFRWTSAHAVLRIHGPSRPGGQLIVRGRCPVEHMPKGPLRLTVTVDGKRYPVSVITERNLLFEFRYDLDDSAAGKPSMEVAFDVDRTLQVPGDRRTLGLALSTVEVVP